MVKSCSGHIYNVPIREDIDFGIAVESWRQYERLKQILVEDGNFRADKKATHRLWHGSQTDEIKTDFSPYGGVESPAMVDDRINPAAINE